MSLTTCSIAGLNLLAAPYTVESFDLPDASVSELGRAAQLAGAIPCRAHYEEPPWALTIIVRSSVSADISNLHTKFRSGAALVFGEGATSLTTYLRSVEATTTANYSGWARVTFSGLRSPEWEGTPVDLGTLTVTDGWGTVDAPAVGGEIAAKVRLYARSAAASTGLYIGVRPTPLSGYAPLDDYSGSPNADGIGGAWSLPLSETSSLQVIATPPQFPVAPNRGRHMAVARLNHSSQVAANQKFQAQSYALSASRYAPSIIASAVNVAAEVDVLGTLPVPASEWPLGTNTAASFSNVAGGASYANGTLQNPNPYTINPNFHRSVYYETFTLAARAKLTQVAVTVTGAWGVVITRAASGAPTDYWEASLGNTPSDANGLTPFGCDVVLDPGTYCITLWGYGSTMEALQAKTVKMETPGAYASGVGGYMNNSGTWVQSTLDLSFALTWYDELAGTATMPVSAASTEATRATQIDALMRVPVDFSALACTTAIGAGAGVMYDPDTRTIYPCDTNALLSGTSLMATADLLGTARGIALAPNTTNRFVVANGAKSTVTLTGSATPCYIRRR